MRLPRAAGHGRWWLLLAGLALCLLLGLWQARAAGQRVLDYGLAHARADAQGLLVWLYDNPFQTGAPQVSTRPAPRLHKARTQELQRPYPFSWRWLALLEAPADGAYVLGVYSNLAVRLRLDGRPLIESWVADPPRREQVLVELKAGPHLLDLADVQDDDSLDLLLYWIPPGAAQAEAIPSQYLRPLDVQTSAAELYRLYFSLERWRALAWLLPPCWLLLWWLVLRDWRRSLDLAREHWPLLAIIGLAGVLWLAWADRVPGVSGESAFFIWRAELILEGARPILGMNARTGPLFDYLLALPVLVFGATPLVIKVACVLPNLLALVFCYRVFGREAGRPSALLACLMLALCPAVVMFLRNPAEFSALGPLLFFLGLDLLSLSRQRPPLALLAGLLWGLGLYNHSVFAVFPVTLGLAGLVVSRLRLLAQPQLWGLGLGMLLTMLPRYVSRLLLPDQEILSFFDPGRLAQLGGFLKVFWRTLDGEVVYKLFTGQHLMPTYGILPAVLLAAVPLLLWGWPRRRDGQSWVEAVLGLALPVYLVMTPVGAPTANPRYFTFACLLAMLLLGRAWARGLEWSPRRWRPLVLVALTAYAALSLTSLGVNYFYSFLSTGGRPLEWNEPLLDHVSDAWMDHEPLVKELTRRGYPVVATGDYWHHTLHLALNLYQDKPPAFWAVDIASRSNTERAAVFYNSPEGRERLEVFVNANQDEKYRPVSLGPELDQKYLLIEKVWPPVPYPPDVEAAP
ncbi:MAG: glycosyltransferase family 39 protein [Desulfarculus sp.]|nr:glycosyltransferase family 39 protein [Desulfarculus sp.]